MAYRIVCLRLIHVMRLINAIWIEIFSCLYIGLYILASFTLNSIEIILLMVDDFSFAVMHTGFIEYIVAVMRII